MALLQRTRFYFRFLNAADLSEDVFVVENQGNPSEEIRRILIDNSTMHNNQISDFTFSVVRPQDAIIDQGIPRNDALIMPVSTLNSFYAFETSPSRPYFIYIHDGQIPEYLFSSIAQTLSEFLNQSSRVENPLDDNIADLEDKSFEDKSFEDRPIAENEDEPADDIPINTEHSKQECCRCQRVRRTVDSAEPTVDFKCGDPAMDYSELPTAKNIYGVLKVIREQLASDILVEPQMNQLKDLETNLCSQICALENPDLHESNITLNRILQSAGADSVRADSADQNFVGADSVDPNSVGADSADQNSAGPNSAGPNSVDQNRHRSVLQTLENREQTNPRRRPKKRAKHERSRRAILNDTLKKTKYRFGTHLKKLTTLVQAKEDDPTITLPAVANKLSTTKYSFFETRDGTLEIPSLASPFVNLGRGYYIHRKHVTPEFLDSIIDRQKVREEELNIWTKEREAKLRRRLETVIEQNSYRKWIPKAFILLANSDSLNTLNTSDETKRRLEQVYKDLIRKLKEKYPRRSDKITRRRIKKEARKLKFF